MSNTMNHRAYFNGHTSFSWTQNYSSSSKNSATSRYMRSCTFRFIPEKSEFSPVEFLKHLAERVTRALRLVSAERRRKRRRHLPHDSSPYSSLGRSNSKAGGGGSGDSYRSDAVEDCIEFIHSSFSRSNSSANSLNSH